MEEDAWPTEDVAAFCYDGGGRRGDADGADFRGEASGVELDGQYGGPRGDYAFALVGGCRQDGRPQVPDLLDQVGGSQVEEGPNTSTVSLLI